MWNRVLVVTGLVLFGACNNDETILVPIDGPAPPIGVDAGYYNRAVTVYWDLSSAWNGETFRIFGKRAGDTSFFLIAEVTSCSGGDV